MRAELEQMKEIAVLDDTVSIKSAMHGDQEEALVAMADRIVDSLRG
jgi:hypothetical protein